MVVYFNKTDMISFAEYMVSEERTQSIINHSEARFMPPVDERLKMVHNADYENWLAKKEKKHKDVADN